MALKAGRVGVNPSQLDASGNIIGGGGGGGSYTLPTATNTRLGGVKIGSGITVAEDGTISAEGGGSYELPTATTTRLGGVKIGQGIHIATDGMISIPDILGSVKCKVVDCSKITGIFASNNDTWRPFCDVTDETEIMFASLVGGIPWPMSNWTHVSIVGVTHWKIEDNVLHVKINMGDTSQNITFNTFDGGALGWEHAKLFIIYK